MFAEMSIFFFQRGLRPSVGEERGGQKNFWSQSGLILNLFLDGCGRQINFAGGGPNEVVGTKSREERSLRDSDGPF